MLEVGADSRYPNKLQLFASTQTRLLVREPRTPHNSPVIHGEATLCRWKFHLLSQWGRLYESGDTRQWAARVADRCSVCSGGSCSGSKRNGRS